MMDPHAVEVVLLHSTTLLPGGLAGFWASAIAGAYARKLAGGADVDWSTLAAAMRCQPAMSSLALSLLVGLCFGVFLFFLGMQAPTLQVFLPLALACWLLLLLGLIDARTGYLPDALTVPYLLLGVAMGFAHGGLQAWPDMASGLAAAVAVPGVCMVLHWLRHRSAGMGWGDMKLLAGMGVWLGAQGVISALLVACLCGLAFTLWRNRGLRLRAAYPFGPFLVIGTLIMLLHSGAF
jgi:prepilin signal peptidase PulO-like enzyme (type II secretory pathway)